MSAMDLFNLSGKVALVTGASRGLGAGMAIGLAEAGADIISIQVSLYCARVVGGSELICLARRKQRQNKAEHRGTWPKMRYLDMRPQ